MVKKILLLLFCMPFLFGAMICAPHGTTVDLSFYKTLDENLLIILPEDVDEIELYSKEPIVIPYSITCNGKIKIKCDHSLTHNGEIQASQVVLEAVKILLNEGSRIEAGSIYVGGGWQGQDPAIQNAKIVIVSHGAQLVADARVDGDGGTVVIWSEQATAFEGAIFSRGKGSTGRGGEVEVSSGRFLHFDGEVDVSAESPLSGHLLLDPVSITIQSASPDINGNGGGLDMTTTTQLNNATTTPAGFPNAASIITAGAVAGLLTNNVSMTLAAQNFISVNAAIAPAGTNVTFTLAAPTVNLNSPITLAAGGVLAGSGVTVVNVGASGSAQNGINVVSAGGVVNLGSAIYNAPLNISNKSLTLNGNGQSLTTVKVVGAIPTISGRNSAIYVTGGTNVVIQNLTVDCNYIGFPTNPSIVGILYENAGGTIFNNHVTHVANSPPPYGGGQQGQALRILTSSGGPYTVNVDSNTLDFFQKAGIVANGAQLIANLTNNSVVGPGSTSSPATIGVQFSGGTATISGNTVTGIAFADHASSAAVFVFNTGSNVVISDNQVGSSDNGIIAQNSGPGLIIENNTVQNSGDTGIAIFDTTGSVSIQGNNLTNNGGSAAPGEANSAIYVFSSTLQQISVEGNTITQPSGVQGVFTQGNAAGQAPNLSLSGNTYIDP